MLPDFDLTDRTAIVTGGSRGLGKAMALAFAEAGASVVVASRKADGCRAVVAEIEAAGGRALAQPTHVGRPEELDALATAAVDAFGSIDILVNNAANPLAMPIADATADAFDASYRVNVRGPLLLSKACLPELARSAHASVINVITVGAFSGAEYLGLYTSGKAALWNLTRTMAQEFGVHGIRVNALAPGPFETDMMAPTYAVPEFNERIIGATIQKRVADPSEITGAALLLASDAGSYMTGSCLVVDGGTVA